MFTIKQAAQTLGIHPKTLRRWEDKGRIIPRRTLGNQRRFSQQDLETLKKIKAGEPVPPAPLKVITKEEAAKKMAVSPVTIDRWTKAGKLRPVINDQLCPGYLASDLQGRTLPAEEVKLPEKPPARTDFAGKFKYAGPAALALSLATLIYFQLQPRPLAEPAVLENQTPVVDVALPRTAQFLDGRISLGLDSGDLFYADANGNLYLKNSALIDQAVFTRRLQLLPGPPPEDKQIGQLYVDQDSGDLKYFDGFDWNSLNQSLTIASNSAGLAQSAILTGPDIDLTLGELFASASATSLRITLAGDQSIVKISGGANQNLAVFNDDALYPVIFSQPTQILGNLYVPKLVDNDQNGYFLDPSSETVSLAVAGDATISSTLTFSQNGEYLTNSTDDYLISSGGLGVGGSASYGFSSTFNLNAKKGNFEDEVNVRSLKFGDNKIEVTNGNGLYLYDDSNHGIFIADGGSVGIATTTPGSYKLNVNGNVYVNGDIITASGAITPDYVFEQDYPLLSPVELKNFITLEKHLPGIPSASEIAENGLNLKQLLLAILEKTEENTLYILDLYDRLDRIITPTVETEVLTTKFISPLAGSQITISGDASVSGTLYASEIESSTIDRIREKISRLTDNLASAPEIAPIATQTAILDNLPPATESGHLSLDSLEADTGFFSDYLAVLGQTTLTDVKINGILTADSITALNNRLYLQPSGLGSISLLAGLMVLDETGQVKINGTLEVSGPIIAQQITPPPGQDLNINIASGSAVSIYAETTPVATFSGAAASFANLNLANAGIATISAGTNSVTVAAEKITAGSQVIVTFTSDSKPADKYWVKKDPENSQFVIFVNYPVNHDTTLDWLMVN